MDTKKRGLYVAVEGIDGAGKTLISKRIDEELRQMGIDSIYVREPWLPEIKKFLYQNNLEPEIESMVFAVDRMVLQNSIVNPSLRQGKVVVSDRTVYSSLAYQYVRGVSEEKILFFNRKVVFPELVFLLDVDVDTALSRLKDREFTRFELKPFLEEVRKRYLDLARRYGFIVVDASLSPEEVFRRVFNYILKELR